MNPATETLTRPAAPVRRGEGVPGIWELFPVAAAGIIYTTHWAIRVGKGISWDQQNYHYYNLYAWLHGRIDYDVAPAGQHNWINPLVYWPQYWLINHVSPITTGVVTAIWQGLNFVLIYLLARVALRGYPRSTAIGLALLCGVVGFRDPLLVSQIGTSDSDYFVSLPILAGLCALCWAGSWPASERQLRLAYGFGGLMLGFASGLKTTCMVYALGMTLAIVVLWPMLRMSWQRFGCYAVGGVLGFLPVGGYWCSLLWSRYRNPFLPYWNDWFRSPWMIAADYRDIRFLPRSLAAALRFPFQWFVGQHPTSESPMRDPRFAFLSVLIPLILVLVIWRSLVRRTGHSAETERGRRAAPNAFWLLILFAMFSYMIWIRLFAIQRYLSPLCLTSGLLLLLALDYLVPSRMTTMATFLLLAVFSFYWMKTEPSDWRVPYGKDWFGVELPQEANEPETLFIMLSGGPMGYIVPYLPTSSRIVRLINSTIPEDGTETIPARRAGEIIAQHSGPIRSLAMMPLAETDYNYLRRFGLVLDQSACKGFHSTVDQFTTCPITRQAASGSETQPHGR